MEITEELRSALGRAIQVAQVTDGDDLDRTDLFDIYMAEPYGDEVEGNSQFVSSDAADAVEALLPDIMDVFTSTENMVEFAPEGLEDEDAAKQETEVCNHIFWQKNNGYLILYTWVKEALIQQNSYVKAGWVEKERVEIEEYEDLTPQEFMTLAQDLPQDTEILESEGFTLDEQGFQPEITGVDPQTGQPQTAPIRLKYRAVRREKEYKIECIPNEEFFISPRWHSLDLDGVPVCGHKQDIERGELRRMGFSEESVASATDESDFQSIQEENRHDTARHFDGGDDEDTDDSTRLVTIYEAYVRADINDDGRAELVRVWASGDGSTLMEWEDGTPAIEEVSGVPFASLTPFIIPHRHVGRSLVEIVEDIQKVSTVLTRQTLDSIYKTVYPRPQYDEGRAGPLLAQDLSNPNAGAPVRTGGADLIWTTAPNIIGTTLPILEKMQDIKEMRTGATRYNQGLDGESLNKTATGIEKIMDAAQKKRLLITRTFAETGIAQLWRIIHRDLRAGPMRKITMRLRNQWIDVDPRTWKHRSDMTVSVGMGSGDRDQKRQGLMLMGQLQEKIAQFASPMMMYPYIRETADRVMETYGFENIDPFLPAPEQMQPPQEEQGPNPLEMQMQLAQQEMQMKAQKDAQEMALKEKQIMLEDQRERERLGLQAQKMVMDDDFKRDAEELRAATGHMRKETGAANITPPISYNQVLNGQPRPAGNPGNPAQPVFQAAPSQNGGQPYPQNPGGEYPRR